MDDYDLKELAIQYLTTFSNKDIEGLDTMFTDDVTLRDWEASAEGREDTIKATQIIFDNVDTIKVTPLAIYQELDTIIAELTVVINDETTMLVTDVINFVDGKISNIRAYRG